jgi:hypothetical protein
MNPEDSKILTDAIGMLTKYADYNSRSLSAQIQKYLNARKHGNRFAPQTMNNAGILEGSNKPKDVIEKENRISLMDAKRMREQSVEQEVEKTVRKSRKNDNTINE